LRTAAVSPINSMMAPRPSAVVFAQPVIDALGSASRGA
jgi:hypothetical protein